MMDKAFFLDLETEKKSRYNKAKFLRFSNDTYDPLTSVFLELLPNVRLGGRYRIAGWEFRPDRISFDIYGSFQYWWIILEYNGIQKNEELTAGRTIYYPELEDLEDLYFSLKSRELGQ